MKRYQLLLKTLDAIESGKYSDLDIHWCSDTIWWLWKFRKITKEQCDDACNRVIAILER